VLELLKSDPFQGAPPAFVRAVMYDYQFTDRAERRATGAWWKRDRRGNYTRTIGDGPSVDTGR
jgi:hypothetical protein